MPRLLSRAGLARRPTLSAAVARIMPSCSSASVLMLSLWEGVGAAMLASHVCAQGLARMVACSATQRPGTGCARQAGGAMRTAAHLTKRAAPAARLHPSRLPAAALWKL